MKLKLNHENRLFFHDKNTPVCCAFHFVSICMLLYNIVCLIREQLIEFVNMMGLFGCANNPTTIDRVFSNRILSKESARFQQ
jgi:hypothetical protein